ncbi:hypothetical protein XELAEV_18008009mg [Xenopus laevis]|uniref:START domain-containing protein n=1 Tax=Xenopus laevis TaxID=8355 RepID=A0A974E2Z7_XENLA|nr:hypothetical protein XELAEV_18008009mg [Xenopus laevis]
MDDLDIPSKTTKLQNTLIQYHCTLEEEWRVAKKSSDVTAWRKPSEEFGGCLYKIEGIVEDDYNRIVDYIRPGPYRLQWDSLMTSMDIIKEFNKVRCVGIEYEDARPNCVRGFNHPCGWFCVPLQNNPQHSLLTGYIQTDLRGMLLQKTVDFAMASSLVNFYSDLKKALKP